MGAKSLYDNVKAGNYGSAAIDAVGMVADAGAIALPGVPGGVGIGIKATRATIAAAQKVDKVATLVKGVEATIDAAETGDVVGAVKSGASVAMGAKASLPGGKSANAVQEEGKALAAVNGNSSASEKAQHGYVIKDSHKDNAVVKNGISGQELNKNGSSPRANKQANAWNNEPGNEGRFKTEVVFEVKKGPGARPAAKEAEKAVSDQNRSTLDAERHQSP